VLKERVITALIMAVVGLATLFLAPPPLFAVLAGVLLLGIGGWEAGRLAGLHETRHAAAFAALISGIGAALFLLGSAQLNQLLLLLVALLWLLLLSWLMRPLLGANRRLVKLVSLGCILLAAWLAVITLQQASPWLVLTLVIIIAAADIGAYFSGRAVGGPKLAPSISPGKTLSGAGGGLVAAAIAAALATWLLPHAPFGPWSAALIGLTLALLSIGGDLFISLLKRQRGLKDTSSLFPGHGGVLDRFDSLGAALPFFALAWLWWGQ